MRIFAGAMALLTAIIVGITSYTIVLSKNVEELCGYVTELSDSARNEDWNTCKQKLDHLLKRWEQDERWFAMFTPHTDLNTVKLSLHQLQEYVTYRNQQEIAVHSSALLLSIRDLLNDERFTLQNLF